MITRLHRHDTVRCLERAGMTLPELAMLTGVSTSELRRHLSGRPLRGRSARAVQWVLSQKHEPYYDHLLGSSR